MPYCSRNVWKALPEVGGKGRGVLRLKQRLVEATL
jgi:hypothetical protein